jgi:C-terminal processing protease CtpA/Prc
LILDLRFNQGGYAEAFAPLLPYLCDRETSLSQFLPENSVYTRFSPRNCDLSLAQLRPYMQSPDADVRATAAALSAEIQAQRGQPWVLEADSLSDERLPCRRSAQQITILTDSACEDEAERFALACRRFSGVRLVGRPTRGSLEYSNPVSADFGFGCSLTYPISRSAACQAGQGYAGSGVPVDVYIPWSPDEIHTDRVLAQALAQ